MKFIYFMICAVFVGIVLSFAYISATAPQPVIKQPTIITPVPTPEPAYGEDQTWGYDKEQLESYLESYSNETDELLIEIIKILTIVAVGMIMIGIIITVFSPDDWRWY